MIRIVNPLEEKVSGNGREIRERIHRTPVKFSEPKARPVYEEGLLDKSLRLLAQTAYAGTMLFYTGVLTWEFNSAVRFYHEEIVNSGGSRLYNSLLFGTGSVALVGVALSFYLSQILGNAIYKSGKEEFKKKNL